MYTPFTDLPSLSSYLLPTYLILYLNVTGVTTTSEHYLSLGRRRVLHKSNKSFGLDEEPDIHDNPTPSLDPNPQNPKWNYMTQCNLPIGYQINVGGDQTYVLTRVKPSVHL